MAKSLRNGRLFSFAHAHLSKGGNQDMAFICPYRCLTGHFETSHIMSQSSLIHFVLPAILRRLLCFTKRSGKAGSLLADGWRAALWLVKADQDMKREALALPNIGSAEPCCNCNANQSTVPWYDFRPEALWMSQCHTVTSWATSKYNTARLYKLKGVSCHSIAGLMLKLKSYNILQQATILSYKPLYIQANI